jgi:hypothetical protein
MNYTGVIIEESLENTTVLDMVEILNTRVAKVVEKHQTPWLEQWTLHDVEVSDKHADKIAKQLSESLESEHEWYADFKNNEIHYIIFKNKIFKVNRENQAEYEAVTKYGISLGIPDYQVGFTAEKKKLKTKDRK